jgi:hypothetical protein
MNTRKIVIGGVVGGVAFFLLGWLIWGILLHNYMMANYNQCAMRPMDQMVWWALILANLAWGFVLSVVFDWSNTSGWKAGAEKGAIFGLLTSLAIDLGQHSMSTAFSSHVALVVDVIGTVVMVAIGGALIGWAMGAAKKKA